MKQLILVLIFLLPLLCLAQEESDVDSLVQILSVSKKDTQKAHVLVTLTERWHLSNPDTVIPLCKKAIKIADNALPRANKEEKISFLSTKASAYNNIGVMTFNKGDIPGALSYYHKALKAQEQLMDSAGISVTLNNIAQVYYLQDELEAAVEYFERAMSIQQATNDSIGITRSINNLGAVYEKMGEFDKGLKYYRQGLKLRRQFDDVDGEAISLNNIGYVHYNLRQFDSTLYYWNKALKIKEQLDDSVSLALSITNLGFLYLNLGKTKAAIANGKKALKIYQRLGYTDNIRDAARLLYTAYKNTNQHQKALEMYELHVAMKDSIVSDKNTKAVTEQKLHYEFEKQQLADSLKKAETDKIKELKHKEEVQRQRTYAYSGIVGFVLMLIVALIAYKSYRQKKKDNFIITKQKEEVEYQKEVVEEKNKEIIDSINYAKRLQDAILPPAKIVKQYLTESFILYKPKDIVAGDFYWMETVNDTVYFAAADCTGHGVPGAMVSVICSNALSKSLIEDNITDVGKLLDRTRQLVVERFGRSEENIQDGMDLALCALNTKTKELKYAGANNPLWIIRKGTEEVEETKADKQPIGKYDAEKPFTTQTIKLNQEDSIYIFSDGYPDQFGGDKGKKYKTGAMKKYLLSIQDKDMTTQRQLLNQEFENWKGDLEQIDDVCVIGVRV